MRGAMIRPESIPGEVTEVSETLEKAGFKAYLVGGCVRDLLLKRAPKDWDLTTDASPEQIMALFSESFCNNDYGTVGIKFENAPDPLKVIEVTPFRSESGYSDSRRPDLVTFGVSLEEDLKRRDFTVNALAYHLKTKEITDLFNGVTDIKDKRIRAVLDPYERFTEDALRMMRAVRLAVELDFVLDSETALAIQATSERLPLIAIERIAAEFLRIIDADRPLIGVVFLEKLGLLEHIVPELLEGKGCEQGGTHAYDVYEHNLRTLEAAAEKGYSTEVRLAALFHDIGKPVTRRTGGKHKEYTFFGHEVVGAKMTKSILKRLKLPALLIENVTALVRWHMFFSDPEEITLAAVRRTIVRIGKDRIGDLLNLRVCDRIGTGRPKEQPFRFRKYKAMVDEALRDPLTVSMLRIDGNKIMEITGEKPGKRLGFMLHALLEDVLNDPTHNTEIYLFEAVKKLSALPDTELEELGSAGKERLAREESNAKAEIARKHRVN